MAVPYHLDERLASFDVGLPIDHEVTAELPPGGPWQRMAALYDRVAGVVGSQSLPVLVVSGDCTTSLGVLAGLQRAGHDVGIVWLDAHADFHTETTTTSGYRGGMPLALAVGVGTLTCPARWDCVRCRSRMLCSSTLVTPTRASTFCSNGRQSGGRACRI